MGKNTEVQDLINQRLGRSLLFASLSMPKILHLLCMHLKIGSVCMGCNSNEGTVHTILVMFFSSTDNPNSL